MASYRKLCWEAADVRCPFYKKDSREERSIRCEGFEKGCLVESRFQSLPQRERRMGRYCVSRYEDCPVYKNYYNANKNNKTTLTKTQQKLIAAGVYTGKK